MLLTIDRRVPRGHLSKPTFDKARRTRRRTPVLLNPPMNSDEKRVARAIEDGVRDARERVRSPRLLEAIRMRNPDEIVASVPLEPLRGIMRPIETVYRDQVVKAGNKAFAGSNSALRFATTDKVVIDAAAQRAGALVQNITTEQLTSLRGAIVDAVAGQYDVEDTASIIRSSIGLTPRYQQAVARNFDLVKQTQIAQGASMRQANAAAEQSARRYADRLVRSRARTIAQTEVHQMNNVGKQKAWEDMFADGTILPDTYKVWVGNFGACDICMGFNGEAVPVTQPFSNGNQQPEAHPNCRCTAEFESDEEYAARTGTPLFEEVPTPLTQETLTPSVITPTIGPRGRLLASSQTQLTEVINRGYQPKAYVEVGDEIKEAYLANLYVKTIEDRAPDLAQRYRDRIGALGFAKAFPFEYKYSQGSTVYANGGVTVTITKGAKLSKADEQFLLDTIDELMLQNPKTAINVIVGATGMSSVSGKAIVAGTRIIIQPKAVKRKKQVVPQELQTKDLFMPSIYEARWGKYVLAHEWGHSIDKQSGDAVGIARRKELHKKANQQNMSGYGLSNDFETIAEAHAEWFNTKGATTNPLVQEIAKEYGWQWKN